MTNINLKRLLPLLILCGLIFIAFLVFLNPPETKRKSTPGGPVMTVETINIEEKRYVVQLQSYGTVRPRTQSMLVAQVTGQVIWIDPEFRDGGIFQKGDVLLKIDPRDYEADVKIAEAALLDAQRLLTEEQSRAVQAKEDWQRLGNSGPAPSLVLREPQLLAAEARKISSEASLTKANLDLERTEIKAPFNSRIRQNIVDLGQVVNTNSQLGEIYATDYAEIRLPLRNGDLAYIDLPEVYGAHKTKLVSTIDGVIYSALGHGQSWPAKIVRTEGAIDESSRQLHVIAQIDDPFAIYSDSAPMKVGEYVTATIKAKSLDKAIVIPNKAIYQGTYVVTVEEGVLSRRNIVIGWQNEKDAIITSGLTHGEQLVVTPLGQVTSGVRVSVLGEIKTPELSERPAQQQGRPAPKESMPPNSQNLKNGPSSENIEKTIPTSTSQGAQS